VKVLEPLLRKLSPSSWEALHVSVMWNVKKPVWFQVSEWEREGSPSSILDALSLSAYEDGNLTFRASDALVRRAAMGGGNGKDLIRCSLRGR